MLNISELDVKHYNEQGYVVSNQTLSTELLSKITNSYDEFITTNPNLTLEEMASPHIYGGVNMKHKINESIKHLAVSFGFEPFQDLHWIFTAHVKNEKVYSNILDH